MMAGAARSKDWNRSAARPLGAKAARRPASAPLTAKAKSEAAPNSSISPLELA